MTSRSKQNSLRPYFDGIVYLSPPTVHPFLSPSTFDSKLRRVNTQIYTAVLKGIEIYDMDIFPVAPSDFIQL